jgi:hypothetical protein
MFSLDGRLNFHFLLMVDQESKQYKKFHQDYKGYNDPCPKRFPEMISAAWLLESLVF